jgi:hypothetical protein
MRQSDPRNSRSRRGATGGDRENTLPREEEENTLRFHYDREERIKLAGDAIGSVDKRPWYRRNRGTLILLLDISLIVVIFTIYNVFLRPNLSVTEFGDHRYELRALEFDAQVLATLRIYALEDQVPGSSGLIQLQAFPAGSEEMAAQISDILPDSEDQERIVRFRLDRDLFPDEESLSVEVRGYLGNKSENPVWDFSVSAPVELE